MLEVPWIKEKIKFEWVCHHCIFKGASAIVKYHIREGTPEVLRLRGFPPWEPSTKQEEKSKERSERTRRGGFLRTRRR